MRQIETPYLPYMVTPTMFPVDKKTSRTKKAYEFKPSLELSLLPYVEKYRSSTYFLCAPQLMTGNVLVGSGWPGGFGSYRRSWHWYDPTKHTSPNYRPWVMSPTYGFV